MSRENDNRSPQNVFTQFATFAVGGSLIAVPFFGIGPFIITIIALSILVTFFKKLGE